MSIESSVSSTTEYVTTDVETSTFASETTTSDKNTQQSTKFQSSEKTTSSTDKFFSEDSYTTSNLSVIDLPSSTPPAFEKTKTTSSSSFTDSEIAAAVCISLLCVIIIALVATGFFEWIKQCRSRERQDENDAIILPDDNEVAVDFTEINRQDADGNSGESEQTELTWEIDTRTGTNFPTVSKAFYNEHKKNFDPTSLNVGQLYDTNDTTGMY